MTDRVNALIVVLNNDTRDDDVQPLVQAILQLRNVMSVDTRVVDISDHIAEKRVKHAIWNKIIEVLE